MGWNHQLVAFLPMGVSENNGIPKSSIFIGFSIMNHPFWGTPIFGNTQIISISHVILWKINYQIGKVMIKNWYTLGKTKLEPQNGGGWFRWFSFSKKGDF